MSSHIESQIEQAYACFQKRDFAGSEQLLTSAIAADPQHPTPRAHLANLLCIFKRYDEAIETLQPVLHEPGMALEHEWASFNAAWVAGKSDTAYEKSQRLLEHEGVSSERLHTVLKFARQAGYFDLAQALVERLNLVEQKKSLKWLKRTARLLRMAPAFCRGRVLQSGVGYFKKHQRWKRLYLWLEAAHIAEPACSGWPLRLGQLLRQTRDVYDPDFNAERSWYETALRIDPNDAAAFAGLCRTLFDMGNWAELIDKLRHHPNLKENQNLAAMYAAALSNAGEMAGAEREYQSCLQRWNQPIYAFCLGLLAMRQFQWTRALEYFDDAKADGTLYTLSHFYESVSKAAQAGKRLDEIDGQTLLNDIAPLQWPSSTSPLKHIAGEACPLCGFDGARDALWRDRTTGWVRVRCPRCSMISVAPMPDDEAINRLYVNEHRAEHTLQKRYKDEVEGLLNASESACRDLPLYRDMTEWPGVDWAAFEQSVRAKQYLDVGCSAGRAVLVMERCGWKAAGIDLDIDAIGFGQALGLDIHSGTIATWPSDPQYDLISLLDVIEHVPDPLALLAQCHQRLKPGGRLIVKTPCADSLPHRFLGEAWLEASEHLQFFSRKTLWDALEKSGFQIEAFKQPMQAPTHFLHDGAWQGRFFPEWMLTSMDQLSAGDTIAILAARR